LIDYWTRLEVKTMRLILVIAIIAIEMTGCAKNIDIEKKTNPITNKVMEEYEIYRDKVNNKPIKHGYYKSYWEDGSFKEIGQYQEDMKFGKWVSYYENGHIHQVMNYKDGELNGEGILYDQYGKEEATYKDGKLNGKWFSYDQEGRLRTEGNYKDGEPDGKWVYYDENGNKKEQHIWKNRARIKKINCKESPEECEN